MKQINRLLLVAIALFLLMASINCKKEAEPDKGRILDNPAGNQEIDIESMLHRGKINIIDFYSEYCPPCVRISPLLAKLQDKRDDIAVIKIDINRPGIKRIDWESPVVKQFRLSSIPHFIVFDKNGNKDKEGKEAYEYVIQVLKDEKII